MKTTKDVWLLVGPNIALTFDTKAELLLHMNSADFLESLPDDAILMTHPAYKVVGFEVPGNEYYEQPKLPNLSTKAQFV